VIKNINLKNIIKFTIMTLFALPVAPLAYAWKNLMIVNPVAGIAVGAVAIVGYAIYEETKKK
jgi:hypothetical protein